MQFIKKFKTPTSYCDDIIKYYHDNEDKWSIGRMSYEGNPIIEKKTKDSVDLCMEKMPDELSHYFKHLINCVQDYCEEFDILKDNDGLVIAEAVNIQKYEIGGGFKRWHTERGPQDPKASKRVLVFMTYLNDAKDSGTEFKYQNATFQCIKGDTLLWPADFTHVHRGQITKEVKYIITGWITYDTNSKT
tara:strand:+ start:939 stop:1505 length:567 start_codon:yes stop_codon:yes gene_type:complete